MFQVKLTPSSKLTTVFSIVFPLFLLKTPNNSLANSVYSDMLNQGPREPCAIVPVLFWLLKLKLNLNLIVMLKQSSIQN